MFDTGLYKFTILKHRGYVLSRIFEDFNLKYGDSCLICQAKKAVSVENSYDEHGRLIKTVHPEDVFEFIISADEVYGESCLDYLIERRFKAEVDLHCGNTITESDFNMTSSSGHKLTRRYICTHCGTDFYTTEDGYTPTCRNCGALMVEDK